MQRYCTRCGSPVLPVAMFCPRCGGRMPPPTHLGPPQSEFYQQAVRPRGKNRIFLAITAVFLSIVIVGSLIVSFVPRARTSDDDIQIYDGTLAGFDFDDTPEAVIDTVYPETTVDSVEPMSGPTGTVLRVTGSNLGGFESAAIGETELSLLYAGEDAFEFIVPSAAQSGDIAIVYPGRTFNMGRFEVLPQEKQLLAEQEVYPGNSPQTVTGGDVSVSIPGSALDSAQTVRIEQIADVHPANLPAGGAGSAISITAGDQHQFGDTLTIEYTLPSELPGAPSAFYLDENTSMWNALPSEIVDGKLRIYTDHLTDFFIFYWGEAVYSPDGYFKIFYQKSDKTNFALDMADLADHVGQTLEEIRKDYEALPEKYRESYKYLGFKDALDVYLDSGYKNGTYTGTCNNILFPTNFNSTEQFETELAHELFHDYQDAVLNELFGKYGNNKNAWAIDALAELAAFELAFPEKKRQRPIGNDVVSFFTYTDVDYCYDMSCFLSYLLKKYNGTFTEMWVFLVDSPKKKFEDSLNDYFRKFDGFISLSDSFPDFWRDVLCNAGAPVQDVLFHQFAGDLMLFPLDKHSVSYIYNETNQPSTKFGLFGAATFSPNRPVRIFNVECTAGCQEAVWTKMMPGVDLSNLINFDFNSVRLPQDSSLWRYLSYDGAGDGGYELYTFKSGEKAAVYFSLDDQDINKQAGIRISEIQGVCKPERIDQIMAGQKYNLGFSFKDIFSHVSRVEIQVDFGDGTVKQAQRAIGGDSLGFTVEHTFGMISGKAVTCSMYDISGGKKELISQLVMPMTVTQDVAYTVSPNPAEVGTPVTFQPLGEIPAAYTLEWDFGDGRGATTKGGAQAAHVYSEPGYYQTELRVYDAERFLLGTAFAGITVTGPIVTETPTPESSPSTVQPDQPFAEYLIGKWYTTFNQYSSGEQNNWEVTCVEFFPDGTVTGSNLKTGDWGTGFYTIAASTYSKADYTVKVYSASADEEEWWQYIVSDGYKFLYYDEDLMPGGAGDGITSLQYYVKADTLMKMAENGKLDEEALEIFRQYGIIP